jgi:hypothetical protein
MNYTKGSTTKRQKKVLKIYKNFNNINRHKMKAIPVCKIGE